MTTKPPATTRPPATIPPPSSTTPPPPTTTPPPSTTPPPTTEPPKPEPPPFVNVHFQHGFKEDELKESEIQLHVEDDEKSMKEVTSSLKAFAKKLSEHPDFRYEVQGHADASGDEKRNMDLSRNRAASVMDYLIQHGAKQSQLKLVWFGERVPSDPGRAYDATKKAKPVAKDRRAEVHMAGPKKCPCGKHTCPQNRKIKPINKYNNLLPKLHAHLG